MKRLLCTAAMICGIFSATSAHATDNWREGLYIKGAGGWNHTQEQDFSGGASGELDEGYAVSGAVGYNFGAGWRSELEVAYRNNDVDSLENAAGASLPSPGGDVTSTAFMFNGYYDLPTGTALTPYVGAGIGLARVNVDYDSAGVNIADEDSTEFAYQGVAGLSYAISPNADLFAEYKYFATSDIDLGGGAEADYQNHTVLAGLKYNLN